MSRLVVYTCGPMTGLTPEAASEWREHVEARLVPEGFTVASPMRIEGKQLESGVPIAALPDTKEPTLQGPAIYHRDMFDLDRTDILLCNLNDLPPGPVIGSTYEIGYVDALGKAAIVIVAREGNPFRHHPLITTPADILYDELDPALDFIIANFGIYNE